MTNPASRSFADQLLGQDLTLNESQYKEYRMNLERALARAEHRRQIAGYVVGAACIGYVILMFLAGSNALGSVDPWSRDANPLSVTLGIAMVVTGVIAGVGLASYYSRFRPGVRSAREQIRHAMLLDMQRQIHDLREQRSPPPSRG